MGFRLYNFLSGTYFWIHTTKETYLFFKSKKGNKWYHQEKWDNFVDFLIRDIDPKVIEWIKNNKSNGISQNVFIKDLISTAIDNYGSS